MERLTEQIVDWHNRNPLAKRISPIDVHTVGVVALPFMRQSRRAPLPQEPVLQEALDPIHDASTRDAHESLTDASIAASMEPGRGLPPEQDEAGSNEPGAFSRFEAEIAPAATRGPRWVGGIKAMLFRLRRQRWGNHWQWPVFSEQLLPGISAARMARFALSHAYNEVPGDPEWPRRTVEVDEDYVARGSARHRGGAWPFELYLVTAGVDAGSSRSRVVVGQGSGRRLEILGRRCMSPVRVGIAVLLLAGLMAAGWWAATGAGDEPAAGAASAASAASMPASAAAAAASSAASPPAAGASAVPTSAPASAVEAMAAASAPASAAASAAAPASSPAAALATQAIAPLVDIRPQLAERSPSAPPMRRGVRDVAAGTAMETAASAPAPAPSTVKQAAAIPSPSARSESPAIRLQSVAPESKQVALVG
ncbi:MAG TPA: hypothetical protein VGE47_07060, partial [Burkholderiaceae bacterium]